MEYKQRILYTNTIVQAMKGMTRNEAVARLCSCIQLPGLEILSKGLAPMASDKLQINPNDKNKDDLEADLIPKMCMDAAHAYICSDKYASISYDGHNHHVLMGALEKALSPFIKVTQALLEAKELQMVEDPEGTYLIVSLGLPTDKH